jgi:hypothetical protein
VDSGQLIAEVARRDGVLLDRNDPVLVVATALDVVMSEHRAALAAAAKPIPESVLRQAVIQGIAAHAPHVVRALRLRTALAAAAIAASLMLVGAAGGWLWFESQNAALLAWGKATLAQCANTEPGGECHIRVAR